jgi:hypothetical protein
MSRDVSSGFKSAIEGDVVKPFLAIDLQFDSGNVRAWTGLGTLSVGGVEYLGTATIMSVSPIEETVEIAARGAQFVLTGIPSDLISLALSEPYQGRIAKIYFGMLSVPERLLTEAGAIITTENLLPLDISGVDNTELIEIFSGFMDVMQIADEPETATITMTAENRLISLERPKVSRYTSEDQKRKYPADQGFDFVNDLQDKEVKWGGG